MTHPAQPQPNPDAQPTVNPPAGPPCVSTHRRQFFREILSLGLQGAENIVRDVAAKPRDLLQALSPSEPNEDPPAPLVQPPQGRVSRHDSLDL